MARWQQYSSYQKGWRLHINLMANLIPKVAILYIFIAEKSSFREIWQIYILSSYTSSENFTIGTTYHIMLFIVVVWHINVSSFCISLQIHSARAMRSESSSLLHFNIRQINEDSSEDATSLGRRQHCWEVFQVGSILFHFWSLYFVWT